MNIRKRLPAILLALALLLTGCNTVPAPTNPTTTETVGSTPSTVPQLTQPTEPGPNVVVQHLPEEIDNPEDIPVLKWVVMTEYRFGRRNQTRSEDAVRELNQMLAEKDMPFRLQFVILSLDTPNADSDWFSRPEALKVLADADLVWGNMGADEMREYLLPITEYVTGDAEPSLKNTVAHDLNWLNATVEGEIYAIPTVANPPYSVGWEVSSVLLTEFGFTEEDFQRAFWEMDDIFAQIYEKNGNKPFLYFTGDGVTYSSVGPGALSTKLPTSVYSPMSFAYQFAGVCFGIDHSAQKPTVVNLLETDMCRNLRSTMKKCVDSGYVMTAEQFRGGVYEELLKYNKTVGDTVYTDTFGNRCVPIMPSCYNSFVEGNYSGVIADSLYKEEALQLLKLIAEDEAFRMQLSFGKEGRDYEIVDGYYTVTTREDGSRYNLGWLSMLDDFSGFSENPLLSDGFGGGYRPDKITHQGKTALETYQCSLDNIGFIYYPIVFDYSALEQEVTAIDKILHSKEFGRDFLNMSGEDYGQMLQQLKDAGCEEIIAELQRQLDEWLAANPDWQ